MLKNLKSQKLKDLYLWHNLILISRDKIIYINDIYDVNVFTFFHYNPSSIIKSQKLQVSSAFFCVFDLPCVIIVL